MHLPRARSGAGEGRRVGGNRGVHRVQSTEERGKKNIGRECEMEGWAWRKRAYWRWKGEQVKQRCWLRLTEITHPAPVSAMSEVDCGRERRARAPCPTGMIRLGWAGQGCERTGRDDDFRWPQAEPRSSSTAEPPPHLEAVLLCRGMILCMRSRTRITSYNHG